MFFERKKATDCPKSAYPAQGQDRLPIKDKSFCIYILTNFGYTSIMVELKRTKTNLLWLQVII